MNGNQGPGPLLIAARREFLSKLLALQEEVQLQLISPEELLLIQQMWKAARDPDDGRGVARIVGKQPGVMMNTELGELSRLREIEDKVAAEKGLNVETLRRMVAKVEEYSESHRLNQIKHIGDANGDRPPQAFGRWFSNMFFPGIVKIGIPDGSGDGKVDVLVMCQVRETVRYHILNTKYTSDYDKGAPVQFYDEITRFWQAFENRANRNEYLANSVRSR
jgi:hypothetical protein